MAVRVRIMALVVALIAVVALVAGCGSDGAQSVPTTSATPALVGAPLPADFPKASVPLIAGTVQAVGGTADEGWNLTVQGQPNSGVALDNAVRALTSAGYTENSSSDIGGHKVVTYSATKGGSKYVVSVGAVPSAAGGPNSVYYEVGKG